MAVKTISYGDDSILEYSLDGSTSWAAIGKMVDMQGSKVTAPEIDITTPASASDETVPGRAKLGDNTLHLFYTPTLKVLVDGWMASQTRLYIRVTVIDGTTTHSTDVKYGYVKDFDAFGSIKRNDKLVSTITWTNSGGGTNTAFTSGT